MSGQSANPNPSSGTHLIGPPVWEGGCTACQLFPRLSPNPLTSARLPFSLLNSLAQLPHYWWVFQLFDAVLFLLGLLPVLSFLLYLLHSLPAWKLLFACWHASLFADVTFGPSVPLLPCRCVIGTTANLPVTLLADQCSFQLADLALLGMGLLARQQVHPTPGLLASNQVS